jgi:hypothetical protein
MEKPLSARLHEKVFGGSPMSTGIDRQLLAQSFGVSIPAGKPFAESPVPELHVDHEVESGLLHDKHKASAKPELKSILELAAARLQSIKPRTIERAREVAQLITDLQEPLKAVDEMFAILETERVEALEQRAEQLRVRGRELRDKIEHQLQASLFDAMHALNASSKEKKDCEGQLGVAQRERTAIKKDRFATDKQRATADAKVTKAASALVLAQQTDWKRLQAHNDAENAVKLAQSELRNIEIAIDQCAAEIAGQVYHDTALGLSVDPTAHLAQ